MASDEDFNDAVYVAFFFDSRKLDQMSDRSVRLLGSALKDCRNIAYLTFESHFTVMHVDSLRSVRYNYHC